MEIWNLGPPILVGEKIKWYENNNKISHSGTVRWIGRLPEISADWMVGIELDKALIFGGTDGFWKNRKLFPCKPRHGLLVPIQEVVRQQIYPNGDFKYSPKSHYPDVIYRNRSSPNSQKNRNGAYGNFPPFQHCRLSTIQDEESSKCEELTVPEDEPEKIKNPKLRKKGKSEEYLSTDVNNKTIVNETNERSQNDENVNKKVHRRRKHYSKVRNIQSSLSSDRSSDESDFYKRSCESGNALNKNLDVSTQNDAREGNSSNYKREKENQPVATPRRKAERRNRSKNNPTFKTNEKISLPPTKRNENSNTGNHEPPAPINNFKFSEKRHSFGAVDDDERFFADFNAKLLMMNGIEIPNVDSRREKNNKGIFSFLKWFKKNKSMQDFDAGRDVSLNSSPLLVKRHQNSSCGSLDTLLSTATVTSFAFVHPTQYQKAIAPPEVEVKPDPEVKPKPEPEVKQQPEVKPEVKHQPEVKLEVKLQPEVKPQAEVKHELEVKKEPELKPEAEKKVRNENLEEKEFPTARRKKRRAPDPPSLPNTFLRSEGKVINRQHRRTVSESFKDRTAGAYCHVKGKRKAPSPPKQINLYPSLDRLKTEYPSLSRKRKPAPAPPPPPVKIETEEDKPKISISSKPWYKRSGKDKNPEKKKEKEYEDWMPEVGFSRPIPQNDVNLFNKIFPWMDEKKEEKRKSNITMLVNISELDREAAEILKKGQAQEKEIQEAQDAKFYSDAPVNNSTRELISMFNAISDVSNRPKASKKQKESPHSVWICSKCTLENDSGKIVCAACNVPKIPIPIEQPEMKKPKVTIPTIDWEKELQFYCPKNKRQQIKKKFEEKNILIDIAPFEDRMKEKKIKLVEPAESEPNDKSKLKEMLKEMKNSLPKQGDKNNPENKLTLKEGSEAPSDIPKKINLESPEQTRITEDKPKKVSNSAQTSTFVKPKKNKKFFELYQESDLENIVKHKGVLNHLYANVKDLSFEQDEEKKEEETKVPEDDVKEIPRLTTELVDIKAEVEEMPQTNMNTISINNVLKKLETAIANGQHSKAADLAKELAKMKINCNVTRLRPSPEPPKDITVDLYVEDKVSHQGPIPFKVTPSMTVTQLKYKIEKQYEIPATVQRWILGKQLASDDSKTLEHHGVTDNHCSIFLYLVAPERKKPETTNPTPPPSPIVILTQPIEKPPPKAKTPSPFREICSNDEKENEEDEPPKEISKPDVIPPESSRRDRKEERSPEASAVDAGGPPVQKPAPKKTTKSILPPVEPRVNEALKRDLKVISANAVRETIVKLNMTHIAATKTDRSNDGWKCNVCTLVNTSGRPGCAACSAEKPFSNLAPKSMMKPENKKEGKPDEKMHYLQLLHLDNTELVPNTEEFECPICIVNYTPGEGVILRDCLHTFCRACLINTVQYSEEAEVKCPYRDDNYSCDSILQQREIKALVPKRIFEQHLARSVSQAENKIQNTFHCKTPDCKGWCILENNVNEFRCPVCNIINCLTCQAIHPGLNCKEYQDQLRHAIEINPEARKSREMLEEMVERGEAMACPTCQVVLMKKWGCDWLKCSMCKTEICWVTRKPRWGPGGKGDTSAGCQCGVNGVKCHPKCNYCH